MLVESCILVLRTFLILSYGYWVVRKWCLHLHHHICSNPSNEYTGAGAFAKLNVIYGVKFDIVLVKSLMQSKV